MASHDRPVNSWTVQPTVYLAIAAAISNSAVAFAHARAVPVAWWYRASRGSTIASLDQQWHASFSVAYCMRRIRHVTLVLAATILVSLMVIDGPLLQRASSVVVATQSNLVSLEFSLTPELPTGMSGFKQYNNLVYYQDAIVSCTDWMDQAPIPLPVNPGCKGTCVGKVTAPGLAKTLCTSNTSTITSEMWHDADATWGREPGSLLNILTNTTAPIFEVTLAIYGGTRSLTSEAAILYVGLAEVINSSGSYTGTACSWVPAMLEYDVEFGSNGHVRLLQPSDSTGNVVALANNTSAVGDAGPLGAPKAPQEGVSNPSGLAVPKADTMDLFPIYLAPFYNADAYAMAPLTENSTWAANTETFNAAVMKYQNHSASEADIQFTDPTVEIVHALNEVMFRAAVKATSWSNVTSLIDKGLAINQTTTANQTVTHNVFHSDFRWYAAATALEIVIVLSLLPMFWGWWKLDSELDLSPFAVGLALDAPLFRDAEQQRGMKSVLRRKGDVEVRYGPIAVEEDTCACLQEGRAEKVERQTRMGLAESCKVVPA